MGDRRSTAGKRLALGVWLVLAAACGGKSSTQRSVAAAGQDSEVAAGSSGQGGKGGDSTSAANGGDSTSGGGDEMPGGAGNAEPAHPSDLPELTLVATGEILLRPLDEPAEDLYVRDEGIFIVTRGRRLGYDLEGNPLSSSTTLPNPSPTGAAFGGTGVDTTDRLYATVSDTTLLWAGWEIVTYPLEGAALATGVAIDFDAIASDQSLFVTDAGRSAVREYTVSGAALRELSVERSDLQGIAFSPHSRLFVLDAKHGELLRIAKDFSNIDAWVHLPDGIGIASGIHWWKSVLYVCFRDTNRVSTFAVDDGN
ncbi:MAG: hypothetical protein WDO69_35155 [Pseudomonadota bacterium]